MSLTTVCQWPLVLTDLCLLLTASLQAQVVLSFQAYPTARCVLLEVQVPAVLVQPGQSVVCEVILLLIILTTFTHFHTHYFFKSWISSEQ
jgi:hypothetical protein